MHAPPQPKRVIRQDTPHVLSDATSRRRCPAAAHAGGGMEVFELCCRRCGEAFVLCRSCYRGHAYCTRSCRETTSREQKRSTRQRYARTTRGRRKNRERQRRFRSRRREQARQAQGVTDPSSSGGSDRRSSGSQATVPVERVPTEPGRCRMFRGTGSRPAAGARPCRCRLCGREGRLVVVPRGWLRRCRSFVAPDRDR